MPEILLPQPGRTLAPYRMSGKAVPSLVPGPFARVAYAAAHVVVDPLAMADPWNRPVIDWERTLAYREHLWRLGFGVAEAMDTAQRGQGLTWPLAAELIARSSAAARLAGGAIACGAGTDQLDPGKDANLEEVFRAYAEQIAHIEGHGARVVLMASRALCRIARGPADYLDVYTRLLEQTGSPVILHWLGDVFDPLLAGYWGSRDITRATETLLELVAANASRIDGIKVSLLDAERERAMRARLPEDVRLYTGDDFNYLELIEGDGTYHSHALLGIFDAIAPVAAAALSRLGADDRAQYRSLLAPTLPLARRLFEAPTQFYKAGIVLLAWLNGFQNHFTMLAGLQSARGIIHYADVFRHADQAGLLYDPDRALSRMQALCRTAGVE